MKRFVYEAKAPYAFVERNFNLVKRCRGELVRLTSSVVNASLTDATRLYERVGFREQKRYILYRREV